MSERLHGNQNPADLETRRSRHQWQGLLDDLQSARIILGFLAKLFDLRQAVEEVTGKEPAVSLACDHPTHPRANAGRLVVSRELSRECAELTS
jgi:hypothetical protein